MTSRRLLGLSIAALLAVALGVWLATRQTSSSDGERALLYPDLKAQLDAVQAVRIFRAGDVRGVELTRANDAWGVAERGGYAADTTKLRNLLRNLADAKVLEEKTSNPKNYKSLGVEDVKEAGASGVRVEVAGAPSPVNLIVGKSGPGGSSHYVRRAGEQQSWLVSADLDAAATPDAWIRKDVIDVSADRIHSATIATGEHKPYTAAKAARADADFALTDLPKGKQPRSNSVANALATALASVTLTDVQPAAAFADSPPTARATYKTFDGLVVEVHGREREEKRFITLQASYDPALAERFKASASEAAKPAEKTAAAPESQPADAVTKDVAAEAAAIAARSKGWVYEIPSYKYEQIFKKADELT